MDQSVVRLLTVQQAAECANCCPETIRRAYIAGHLKVQRFGTRNLRVFEHDLLTWMEQGMKIRRTA